jgi:predicted PolB exonuclease-like 3'-5' exonuclease
MNARHLIVFDIETVPLREFHEGDDFPKPTYHQVVAIAFLHAEIKADDGGVAYHLKDMRCGGDATYGERDLLRSFLRYCEKLRPQLVTYNGRCFDLPVVKYRSMAQGVAAPWLHHRDYAYRYNFAGHCDLLEALSDHGASMRVRLDDVCQAFGLPGKMGIDGAQVEALFAGGKIKEIRDYCETDVLNTYLAYLRYAFHSGIMSQEAHDQAVQDVRDLLEREGGDRPHLTEFRDAWEQACSGRFLLSQLDD